MDSRELDRNIDEDVEEPTFSELDQFPNYEMLNQYPFTTILKSSKAEVRPKKKNEYLFGHVIAGHLLNFKNGDKIIFKKSEKNDEVSEMLKNYTLDNIIVVKDYS